MQSKISDIIVSVDVNKLLIAFVSNFHLNRNSFESHTNKIKILDFFLRRSTRHSNSISISFTINIWHIQTPISVDLFKQNKQISRFIIHIY